MRVARPGGWHVRDSWVVVVFILAPIILSPPRLHAENGDVLQASTVLRGIDLSDLCFDGSDDVPGGSFWVLGTLNGKIYNLSRDLSTRLREIDNPHGIGQFPDLILSYGIAWRESSNTLFVLAQHGGEWLIKEVDKLTGDEIAEGSFLVTSPSDGAALRGLTYDSIEDELWFRDAANALLYRTSTLSESPPLAEPLFLPRSEENADVKGEGVCFETEESEGTLYVSYGDIFVRNPSRILQLQASDGSCTGVEIPLAIREIGIRGIQTYPVGQQRRVAAIGQDGTIFEIEQTLPAVHPPSQLQCSLTLRNQVELYWTNNGDSVDSTYSGDIQIIRNGIPVATVPGWTDSFLDATPTEGPSRYALRASIAAEPEMSPESTSCLVTVGPGGLVSWTALPDRSLFDVTSHADSGDVYITDEVAGEIVHLDSDLNVLESILSPWDQPGPIAFVPEAEIEIPFANPITVQNVLAVGNTREATASQIRYVDLTGESILTIQLNLRVDDAPVPSPQLGGMAFIPEATQLAILERSTRTIIITTVSGAFVRNCVPSPLILPDRSLEFGLSYEPLEQAFIAPFDDGIAREFLTGGSCLPTGFEFPLEGLGEGFSEEGFLGGTSIWRNTMVVCGRESGTAFKLLVIPAGNKFVRGDFDGSGGVDMTDVVSEATYLFLDGRAPSCLDAGDANDDGELNVADPTMLLFYLFLEGPPPPDPFPDPDSDPTRRDPLGCGEVEL